MCFGKAENLCKGFRIQLTKASNVPFAPRDESFSLRGKGRSGNAGRETHNPINDLTDSSHETARTHSNLLFLF
jgi:hypothetical protein